MGLSTTLPRNELREAVAGIGKIANSKCTLPVLGCVRLRANGREVVAEATDLDQLVKYRFNGAEVRGEGACILPVSALKDLSKGSKNEQVEIDGEDPLRIGVTNHVGGHAVRQTVAGTDLNEWPAMHADVPTKPAEGFLETYRQLVPFASTDETRYVLNSVFVEVGKGEKPITMAATDGRRLACFNSMALPLKKSVVVPVTKFLAWNGVGADVEIGVGEDDGRAWLGVRSSRFFYAVKAVDGTYPNYRQVIPAEPGEHVITFADNDVELLKQVLPKFAGGDEITIVGQDGHVTLYGRGPDDEQWSTLKLENSTYAGDRSFIGLNREYVLDAMVAGFREFTVRDEMCPVLSSNGHGGTHVLMPMRVIDPEDAGEAKAKAAAPEPEPAATATADAAAPGREDEQAEPHTNDEPKRRKKMAKDNGTTEPTALDRALTVCETAKGRMTEVASALADLTRAIKEAAKENKTQASDLEKARATLQKLQAITL